MDATRLSRLLRAAGVNIAPRGNLWKREGAYTRNIGDRISITIDVDSEDDRAEHLEHISSALKRLGIPFEPKTEGRGFWVSGDVEVKDSHFVYAHENCRECTEAGNRARQFAQEYGVEEGEYSKGTHKGVWKA